MGARSELSDSLKETAALDELIDKLLSAKTQQQVQGEPKRLNRASISAGGKRATSGSCTDAEIAA